MVASKSTARKPAAKTPKATVKVSGRARRQTTSDGHRQCAARPSGPYGINAKSQCHNATSRESAALCSTHEREWRPEARRRAAARKAANGAVQTTTKSRGTSKAKTSKVVEPSPTSAEDLETQLAASVAAATPVFANPELAEKAAQKRQAQKVSA